MCLLMVGLDFSTKSSLIINMMNNLGAFRFVLVSRNNGAIVCVYQSSCDQNKARCIPMGIKNAQKYRVHKKTSENYL